MSAAVADDGAPALARRRALPFSPRSAAAVLVALAIAAGGGTYLLAPKASVSTDAAYLQADSSNVAPRIRGLVAEVLVRDNQPVRRGQPLVRIDPEEFDSRLAAAAAEVQDADAAVLAARAALAQLAAEERLAASNITAATTGIAAADAENERAQADRLRFDSLVTSGAVSRREAERYRAEAVAAATDAERKRADLLVSRDQAGVVSARRATLTANLARAEADVARASAARDLVRQDQGHTVVTAPIDGVVGDRQVQVGDYVQPGARLLKVVPLGSLYVTANFKETQVARMRPGQVARIKVDALPGRELTGKVESFAPGSGSQFSLLPFEPGTGNFTKIVQRVPVRIRLDPGQPGLERLRPGLSSNVKVDLTGGRLR